MLNTINLAEKLTKKQLSELGFGPFHIQRLMFALNQEPALLAFLLKNVAQLTGPKYRLSFCQISKIACKTNPLQNLQAYLDHFSKLLEQGLQFENILEFLFYHEAQYIFPILTKHMSCLMASGWALEDLRYFVYLFDNEQQIEMMLAHWPCLVELNLIKPEFDHLVSQPHFEQLMDCYLKLSLLNFKLEEQLLLFKTVYQQEEPLVLFEYIIEKFPILHFEKQYTILQLLEILISDEGIKKLNTLLSLNDKLIAQEFTRHELFNLLNHSQGVFRLQALQCRAWDLKVNGFTPIKIISTVLAEIKDPSSPIYQDEMTQYFNEIQDMREKWYAEQGFSRFLSFFQNKAQETPKSLECLEMCIEEIGCKSQHSAP